MAYSDVADMTESTSLVRREWAAAATEGMADPESWVYQNRWALASQPGWDAAWASALAGGSPDPGADPGVITDGMILSAVQSILIPAPTEEP